MRNNVAVSFYDLIDSWTSFGIEDFTEGIYEGHPGRNYLEAQRAQHDYILDQLDVWAGDRVLDIGCGNGTLLERARERGLKGEGLTISPVQHSRCLEKGLNVKLLDYRDFNPEDMFDGVVANGSLEHFVSPEDALRGDQDRIYHEMFSRVFNWIPEGGKFVTTVIHFRDPIKPKEIFEGTRKFRLGTREFHFNNVLSNLGCFYPKDGQLRNASLGLFKLEEEVEGTEDYMITSEYWLNRLWPSSLGNSSFWKDLFKKTVRHGPQCLFSVFQYIGPQSWNWQFRPHDDGKAPTKLLRQTWRVDSCV